MLLVFYIVNTIYLNIWKHFCCNTFKNVLKKYTLLSRKLISKHK